jgi:SAM-dependent methyltransferase
MPPTDIAPTVAQRYDSIAEHHRAQVFGGPFNDYYERPAMYELLGDVAGQRVLDAGCGPGDYAQWLLHHGATVTAIDSSPRMVDLTRERLGDAVETRRADLNEPLTFINAEHIDTILCSLVLDYIEDWDRLFKEFGRVLRPSGRLVFSVHHPFFVDLKVNVDINETYLAVEQVEEDWLPFGFTIPAYRRPLSAMSESLCRARFTIERIVEPRPTEGCRKTFPEFFDRLSKHPVFLCFAAAKT